MPEKNKLKTYWVGFSARVFARNEKNAEVIAREVAEYLEFDANVAEAHWDNNVPEENIEA